MYVQLLNFEYGGGVSLKSKKTWYTNENFKNYSQRTEKVYLITKLQKKYIKVTKDA